jgi:hypothetical protein
MNANPPSIGLVAGPLGRSLTVAARKRYAVAALSHFRAATVRESPWRCAPPNRMKVIVVRAFGRAIVWSSER